MRRILHHVVFPALIPALFFVVAAMPVEVMGCRNRGLTAVLIALVGALSGLAAVTMGLVRKVRGDASAGWWIASALILVIPAVAVVAIAK